MKREKELLFFIFTNCAIRKNRIGSLMKRKWSFSFYTTQQKLCFSHPGMKIRLPPVKLLCKFAKNYWNKNLHINEWKGEQGDKKSISTM